MADGYLVVGNAAAGSADRAELERAAAVLRDAAATEVVECDGPDVLDDVLAQRDGRTVVVAGGDGSLHLAVKTLRRRGDLDAPVALVPLGTGNDFARGLDVPLDAEDAARALVRGRVRALDLIATDDDEVVVNACHAGLGAAAAERSEGMKERLGALAYPVGALLAGVREAGWQLRVVVDGEVVHDGGTLMVGIANAPYIGGGTRLVPPALPDDGLLDVVVVSEAGPAARIAFGSALRDEAHLEREDVAHVRGSRVEISGDLVIHDADGELSDPLAARTYTVDASAWRFVAPG